MSQNLITVEHENFATQAIRMQEIFVNFQTAEVLSFQRWFGIENRTIIKEMRPLFMLI